MKWLLIVALVFAGILILVIAVGSMLPRKHTAARTVKLGQPADRAWAVISGPPTWRPDVKQYQELPPVEGRRTWRETDKHNQTITYELVESVPPRRLVTRIADPKLPFGGTWTYEIVPEGQTCTLTITEDGEVYNPLFRFVSKFILGHTATIDGYMKALKAHLG